MKTTHRNYDEVAGDFHRLCRLIIKNNAEGRALSLWCVGRVVDWKYGLYPDKTRYPAFTEANAHLWFDGFGELAAFAISESGNADFAVITAPGYRFLYEEALHWVLANWRGRGKLSTELTEFQTWEAEALEQSGFRRGAAFETQHFDLTRPLPARYPLEPGFTIVDMATHPDYRAQRILRDNAFSGRDSLPEEELEHELAFYNHSLEGPIYHAPVDLCVMAPDGRFVAGCEGLIDAWNVEADVERVCTHSAFRRRGFARAVIQECLYRLQAMGLRRAYITGYSDGAIALYRCLGATDRVTSYCFETAES